MSKLPEQQQRQKERRSRGIRMPVSWATVLAGTAWLPDVCLAAEGTEAANAGAPVGTLPLLAALGVGIAVAVGAAVAFLHMTAKGKAAWQDPRQDAEDTEFGQEEDVCDPDFVDSPGGQQALTDYTIPLTRISVPPLPVEPPVEGQPRVCGISGEFSGSSFPLNGRRLSMGRDPSLCDVVFPLQIGEVSRRHCSLSFELASRLFVLEDHGSSNGTFLSGGERLQPGRRYELRAGDRFALSGALHWFEVRD